MIPLHDENPSFLRPFVTLGIIAMNVLFWVFLQGLGSPEPLLASLCTHALIPGELLGSVPPHTVVELGGAFCRLEDPNWTTLFSSMFMHGGWMHLIGNMWFLWIFGNNIEDSMGHQRFLVFYLICGLAAAVAQIAFSPMSTVPMVGASGAIGGVMGAYVLLYPRVRVHMLFFLGFFITTIRIPAFVMLGFWFLTQLVSGWFDRDATGGGTAFWAHIGGFLAGVILIKFFEKRELVERHPHYGWRDR